MMPTAWPRRGLFLLLLCLLPPDAQAADAPAPVCRLPRLGKIVPVMDHGRILLPAKLDGTDVQFLFTNATDSWIRADVADRLGLGSTPIAPEVHVFAGGSAALRERRTGTLDLGGLHWQKFAFLPSPAGYAPAGDVVGTIGADAFATAGVDLEFDLARDAINVIAHNDCPAPPWAGTAAPLAANLDNDGIVFSVTLDGERLRAVVAPALAQTRLPASTARHHFGLFPETERLDPAVHGPETLLPHQFANLQIGDTSLRPVDAAAIRQYALPPWQTSPPLYPFMVQPLDLEWFAAFDPSPDAYEVQDYLMLGVPELRRLRLYFAFGRHQLFVVPAAP